MPQAVAAPHAVVCEEPMEYEFKDGLFYIYDPTLDMRKVMRPAVMRDSIARAARCYAKFRTAVVAEVIQFPGPRLLG